jgi:hypothetical protein
MTTGRSGRGNLRQAPGTRESRPLSKRPPVATPLLPRAPPRCSTETSISPPLGGCTEPRVTLSSAANPCLGANFSRPGVGRACVSGDRRAAVVLFGGVFLGLAALVLRAAGFGSAAVGVAAGFSRVAWRRAVSRCGRWRGRLERTSWRPRPFRDGVFGSFGSLMPSQSSRTVVKSAFQRKNWASGRNLSRCIGVLKEIKRRSGRPDGPLIRRSSALPPGPLGARGSRVPLITSAKALA